MNEALGEWNRFFFEEDRALTPRSRRCFRDPVLQDLAKELLQKGYSNDDS